MQPISGVRFPRFQMLRLSVKIFPDDNSFNIDFNFTTTHHLCLGKQGISTTSTLNGGHLPNEKHPWDSGLC